VTVAEGHLHWRGFYERSTQVLMAGKNCIATGNETN